MSRKTLGLTAGLILALAIGFGAGSFWTGWKSYSAHTQLVQGWFGDIELLSTNSHTARLSKPEDVMQSLGASLDGESYAVSYVFDGLPQGVKDGFVRYAKAARTVAIAQQGEGILNDRRHLLIFADCLQKTHKTGASVRECAKQNGMYGPSTANSVSSSTPEPKVADAR